MSSVITKSEADSLNLAAFGGPTISAPLTDLVVIPNSTREYFTSREDVVDSERIAPGWVYSSATLAAISFLLMHICDMNFCDPDLWHEMALFRQTLVEGRVPTEDRFSYTATVSPSIHHEWGAGMIFYFVATTFGAGGIMFLKYGLVATVIASGYLCSRARGAGTAIFLCASPAMALFSSYGFTTIRAQVFTLALLAIMLCLLELDQRGKRWWIAIWLPLHVVWLNLHAGFIVGAGLMALHACEQIIRKRSFWHFVPVGGALAALIFVNPYGAEYVPYLMHGLTMSRPLIVEWNPLWQHDSRVFSLYLLSLLPIGFAIYRMGFRRLSGIVVLLATAYAAARHTRHLSLYCVVWTCYVPGYLQQVGVGAIFDQFFRCYGRTVSYISVVITLGCMSRVIPAAPWTLSIPTSNADAKQGLICYPEDAINFLSECDFHGNLMLPFEVGGYAMWKLFPKAKVSIDGRYEVAYEPGVLEEHLKLFRAEPGWQEVLARYPTDAVLIPCLCRLSSEISTLDSWNQIYCDGVYEIYARQGISLSCGVATDSIRPRFP